MKMSMEECAAYCAENGMDEAAIAELIKAMFPELHKAAHEANPELAEDPEAVEAAAVAELERAAEMERVAEEEKEDEEKPEALLSEITRLKAALIKERRANALTAVTADLKGRKVSDATKAKLAESYLSDRVAYRALISDLGAAPVAKMSAPVATARTTAPVAPGVGGLNASLSEVLANPKRFADLTEDAQWGMISDLAEREKCAHWLAASWLTTGRMPETVKELRNSRGFSGR